MAYIHTYRVAQYQSCKNKTWKQALRQRKNAKRIKRASRGRWYAWAYPFPATKGEVLRMIGIRYQHQPFLMNYSPDVVRNN